MMRGLSRQQLWRKRRLPPKPANPPAGYMCSLNPFYPHFVRIKDVARANKDLMDEFDSLPRHLRDYENYRP